MARPDDIPEDVWVIARRITTGLIPDDFDKANPKVKPATAEGRNDHWPVVMAAALAVREERERVATFIERRPGSITDRQFLADSVRRGDTYDAHGRFVPGGHQ